jgi:hypothetical protein
MTDEHTNDDAPNPPLPDWGPGDPTTQGGDESAETVEDAPEK